MADLDLEAIKTRALAATPGPWVVGRTTEPDWGPLAESGTGKYFAEGEWWPKSRTVEGTHVAAKGDAPRMVADMTSRGYPNSRFAADAQFIAAARTDVPALIAEVERLRSAADAVLVPALDGQEQEIARLTAEVEKLRAELFGYRYGGAPVAEESTNGR
jgi:hypothetical protein